MALDILPIPAPSVGAESLFSRAKEVATARRSRLKHTTFESLECLHYYWKYRLTDFARINKAFVEDIDDFVEFEEMEEELRALDALYGDDS